MAKLMTVNTLLARWAAISGRQITERSTCDTYCDTKVPSRVLTLQSVSGRDGDYEGNDGGPIGVHERQKASDNCIGYAWFGLGFRKC